MASCIDIARSKTNPKNIASIKEFVVSFLKGSTISKFIFGKIAKLYLMYEGESSKVKINQYFEQNLGNIVVDILTKIHPVIKTEGDLSNSTKDSASMKISDLYTLDEFIDTFYSVSLEVFNKYPSERSCAIRYSPSDHLCHLIYEGLEMMSEIRSVHF